MKRQILDRVQQGELSPGKALNLIQDEYLKYRPNRRLWPGKVDDWLLYMLENLHEKAIKVNEAKKEIEERIANAANTAKRKRRIRIKNQIRRV
ncbi:MAG: hypothetical protein NT078_02215 [Candidatus Azambacteria bacterium]|nr:hypothetical protein [Candidatus Azambacteria bacterium]